MNQSGPMQHVFANTGVQILCFPMPNGFRFDRDQAGSDWNHCHIPSSESGSSSAARPLPFVQWRLLPGSPTRLFLAIDTSFGDPDNGHFCDASGFVKEFILSIDHLLGCNGKSLEIPRAEFAIRPPLTGDPKDVHLVIDFGNSRTGALLLEMRGETSPTPHMLPLHLPNRLQPDEWDATGKFVANDAPRWFSARTHWSTTPWQTPEPLSKSSYREVKTKKGLLGRSRTETVQESEKVQPRLFEDLSMVRIGPAADQMIAAIHPEGDQRTGVSSPKRYLWADDASWLEGTNWYMGDPARRLDGDSAARQAGAQRLQGPLLRYLTEEDSDVLLDQAHVDESSFSLEALAKPRYAPRVLMTAALYELYCQAYAVVNSASYRHATGDPSRLRRIRSITLTYPSGMIIQERHRLLAQAKKAAVIFSDTLAKHDVPPEVSLGLDEASAVHLSYLWSELRMLGQNPKLWFSIVGKSRSDDEAAVATDDQSRSGDVTEGGSTPAHAPSVVPAFSPPPRRPVVRPSASAMESENDQRQEVRIACIDIGGGTSDVMIAQYSCHSAVDDSVHGEILHRDGISLAGDQLVKRILERIVTPVFADVVGLDQGTTQLLFGPEVPGNRELRSQRTLWMNRLFVPLAQAYLDSSTTGVMDPISHTDSRLVNEDVLASLETQLNRIDKNGTFNVRADLGLVVDELLLKDVVHEVFFDLLYDLGNRIVQHDADIVLLAGQPTRLKAIQELVRMLLPLPSSRIIPMHGHYAGNWYPYQDQKGRRPGVIVDPKSVVVVGAAVEFLARHGHLPQFRFQMTDSARSDSYFWGAMTDSISGIRDDRMMFCPDTTEQIHTFETSSQRVLIGRKRSGDENAEASPVYLLKFDTRNRLEPIDVRVRLRRKLHPESNEEMLELESVEGSVAGEPPVIDENVSFRWRTLADEHYYLDSGGLDNIEL